MSSPKLLFPSCSLCQQALLTTVFRNKAPLILKCGHSACEDCVLKEVKAKQKVLCGSCNHISDVPLCCKENIRTEFPVNHIILGKFCEKKVMQNPTDMITFEKKIGFTKTSSEKKLAPSIAKVSCNECLLKADICCVQCKAPYCNKCFDHVHQHARALMGHAKESLKDDFHEDQSIVNCKNHPRQQLEFFCEDCLERCCSHCLTMEHKKHDVSLLLEKNKELMGELVETHKEVTLFCKKLNSSKKKALSYLKKGGSEELRALKKEVSDYFSRLQGLLVVKELEIISKLDLPYENCRCQLQDLVKDLDQNLKDVNDLLAESETVMKCSKHLAGFNILELLNNLKEKIKSPCHIIIKEPEEKPRFIVETDILEILNNHCGVATEETSVPRYSLVSDKEIPEDYNSDLSDDIDKDSQCDTAEESSIDDKKYFSGSSSLTSRTSKDNQNYADLEMGEVDNFEVGIHMKVKISHITSPSNFYVQTQSSSRLLGSMEVKILKMISQKGVSDVFKGRVYLVQYIQNNMWYRGRVLNIFHNGEYDIFYIDYGNSEIVPKERLRPIPSIFLNVPPLATHCRLFNCVPADGLNWSLQALSVMTQTSEYGTLSMVIQKKSIDYMDVDLFHFRNGSNMSLQQSLLFLGLATLCDSSDSYLPSKKRTKKYPSRMKLNEKDTLDIRTTHINTLDDFYVLDVSANGKSFHSLGAEMSTVYKTVNDKLNIYHPQSGMVVAALSKFDDHWHRAEILDVPGTKIIKVFFLDFGITEVLAWNSIKTLMPKFFRFPPLAIHCKLSDVCPVNGDKWDEESCNKFNLMVKDKLLKLSVAKKEKDYYSVVLYSCSPQSDVCINAVLVRENLAKGTGVNSTIVDYPRATTRDFELNNGPYSLPLVLKPKKIRQINSGDIPSLQDDSQIEEGSGPVKVKIHVKRIISPDEFYIIPVFMDKVLEKMKRTMDVHYEHQNIDDDSEKEWNIEEVCAVKIPLCSHLWHRVTILEKLEDDMFKVILLDEGLEKVVERKSIRKLTKEFQVVIQASVRCCMGGITFPQKGSNWSHSSISELKQIIECNENEIYMTKLGEIRNRCLPVELFVRTVIPAGPFDPAKHEWMSINNQLRMGGFAKSDGTKLWEVEEPMLVKPWSMQELAPMMLDFDDLPINNKLEESPSLEEEIKSKKLRKEKKKEVSLDFWTLPEPFPELKFTTSPTYVDYNGNIYISYIKRNFSYLSEIEKKLEEFFGDSKPTDFKWKEGNICAARYHVDNKWYRGEVIKVDNEDIQVRFIDYGNTESCKNEELREINSLREIPTLCHKCSFHTIVPNFPDEIWPESVLDFLHASLVEKSCEVQLTELPEDSDSKYGVTKFWFSDGTEFIKTLVKNGYAQYRPDFEEEPHPCQFTFALTSTPEVIIESDSSMSIDEELVTSSDNDQERSEKALDEREVEIDEKKIEESDDSELKKNDDLENQEKPIDKIIYWVNLAKGTDIFSEWSFKEIAVPEKLEEITVELGAILSPTQILFQMCSTEDDTDLCKIKLDFEKLSEEMQEEAPQLPKLQPPFLYQPCCVKFSTDGRWYRCIVIQEHDKELLVQYIDYGNVETVSTNEVHELKKEWTTVHVQAILCHLHNIKISTDFTYSALNLLTEALNRKPLIAKIMNRNPFEIKIYHQGKLAYSELLEKNFYKSIDTSS